MNELDLFRGAVNKHFAFLCQLGFTLSREANSEDWYCSLEYSSDVVSISVYYGPPEFHADLSFWRKADSKNIFGPSDLSMAGQNPETWKAEMHTTRIEKEVSWLASSVHSVEEQLCSGNIEFYDMLTIASRNRTARWHKEEKLRSVRDKAEVAWKQRDYAHTISLYSSISGELTPLEEKRLSYAGKKLNETIK